MPLHGLRRIRTQIEDDLLELCGLGHNAGTVGHFLKDQIDVSRQGCSQERLMRRLIKTERRVGYLLDTAVETI